MLKVLSLEFCGVLVSRGPRIALNFRVFRAPPGVASPGTKDLLVRWRRAGDAVLSRSFLFPLLPVGPLSGAVGVCVVRGSAPVESEWTSVQGISGPL